MPTRPQKARKLLKQEKAKVYKRTPFTIQLQYPTGENKQDISLGVDAGTKSIGLSATTDKEVLLESEVKLRTDIQDILSTRRSARRARRSRKTRYRQPRFRNRKKEKGWLAPSIQNKVDMHVKVINLLHEILPIKNVVIEAAQFDTQKIKNPSITGDLYQKGDQLGFWNVREYVLFRDNHTCQHCKGKSKDVILNVHHIESRNTGGNSPANLICLCETCHKLIHQEGKEHLFKRQTSSLKDASQMTVMRWCIYNHVKRTYPHVKLTYGFVTKHTRIHHGLEKTHLMDARCISGNPLAVRKERTFLFKQVRRNNRQLHKFTTPKGGKRKNNKAEKLVKDFQLFDKVQFNGKDCFIFGRRKTGYFDLRLLDGTRIHKSANYKKLRAVEKANTLLIQIQRKGSAGCLLS
nr:RNA-guided endonuclease IscB [Salicibibacter halophilus]